MKRVIIWGLGTVFLKYYNLIKYFECINEINVIGVTAQSKDYIGIGDYQFISPEKIKREKVDVIIVANDSFKETVGYGLKCGILKELFAPARVLTVPNFSFEKYCRLKNEKISIISQNCWGGLIYNYLGLEFFSPFINLSVSTKDMIKLMSDFSHYMKCDLEFSTMKYNETSHDYYPVGRIDDVELKFIHYSNFAEAKEKWIRRKQRINYDNLLYMTYTEEKILAKKIANIDVKRKICFTPFEYEADCVYTIKKINENPFYDFVNGSANGRYYYYNPSDLLMK